MKDLTISQLNALGGSVTIQFYADPPANCCAAQSAKVEAPAEEPTPQLTIGVITSLLNNVALKVSVEKAREILGEGNTVEDIKDLQKAYDDCCEVLNATS